MRAEKVVLYIRHQVKDSSGNFYDAEKMDFEYNVVHFHDGEMIQKADVKGYKTKEYEIKKKLFESIWYPYTITEIKL